jgi:hypothetical protein
VKEQLRTSSNANEIPASEFSSLNNSWRSFLMMVGISSSNEPRIAAIFSVTDAQVELFEANMSPLTLSKHSIQCRYANNNLGVTPTATSARNLLEKQTAQIDADRSGVAVLARSTSHEEYSDNSDSLSISLPDFGSC